MKLPVISFPHLWHIGAFDLAQKRPGSLEGACLSVSNCPHAWREISNGLVSGTCYVADTSNIDLIDAHSLDDDTKAKIIEWGVKNGYAEACQIWTVSCDDCETEERTSFIVDNYANAIAELDLDLDDTDPEYQAEVDAAITSQLQHKGTDLLKSLALQVLPIIGDENLLDILLPLWAEDQTDFAGVWWEDNFNPLYYSAPRGGIIASRLPRLNFTISFDEPYEPKSSVMSSPPSNELQPSQSSSQ